MPKGVEHLEPPYTQKVIVMVSSSVMPKGVEHPALPKPHGLFVGVSSSVMPKGVEHLVLTTNLNLCHGCVEFSDAERR